ncbi:hypothetical protein J7413_17830 [Shimia sp. R10_1]|uniref:hypothetical protein n=1 Tax=Shimia sp. R10_1 TaxID=2821095 RepID=UPI001ADA81B7|nr:hypothetical protein [Shimia sp. R10_1]MBO9475413.1 hypothetical protein [Shimia sp. R10_1]
MKYFLKSVVAALVVSASASGSLRAQTGAPIADGSTAFASENAILDTSIPFAIGAREARQALRGAFGWPSFQEGLVEGVYFRFDPDGYARFAPTPRLDVDVFEVICRPRTYACAARKEGLEAFLTERGQLQIKLEEALAGDLFFVSEGVSEIQVPERILQPLDVQLELLLGTGGELLIRRGGTEVSRISLKGFSAVVAYLRWIAARQDYAVLPRGWPIPNAQGQQDGSGMTAGATWNSPMPQPQVLAPGYAASVAAGIAPATSAAPVTLAVPQSVPVVPQMAESAPQDTLSSQELRTELETLKQIILQAQVGQAVGATAPIGSTSLRDTTASFGLDVAQMTNRDMSEQPAFGELLSALERLERHVVDLQMGGSAMPKQVAEAPIPSGDAVAAPMPVPTVVPDRSGLHSEAQKLDFLVTQLGLDTQTALSVLQLSAQPRNAPPVTATRVGQADSAGLAGVSDERAQVPQDAASSKPVLYQNQLVDQILAELEAEIALIDAESPASVRAVDVSVNDYVLLSRYFKSAALPALQDMAARVSDSP